MELTGHPIDVAVGDIRTSQPYNELERTLRVLKNKARLAMDEQGQQLLYLTFGFVRWKNGSVVNNSPLLLMPVSLNSSAHSPIVTLQAADGDIVVNPTLAHLFHEKYYYQLPEFKNSTPAAYMEGLKTAFAHFGWAIIEECRLGIFSFHRMSLYRDMQEQINGIEENPILRQMYAADAFFPSMAESETPVCHVVSADDSQAEAVALSRSGRSIILLGPPGCGKSQSIINMLAQALSDGKTVLFVSKKKAALDIVHQRLKKVGLEQYVLAMHDTTKVNKQQVVKALGESLHQRVVSSVRDAGETAQQLKLLEEKLQRYPHQLHQLHQPLGMSLADAFSKIFALADLPNIQIPLGDVAGMDQAALLATMDQLPNIASAQATMALWGAFKPKLDFGELGAAVEAMKAAGVPPDDYAACYPNRSLAVVAFSEAQQSQIEEQLWEERKNHPELEAFFTENKDEPFIVKNLETIQGDERDTILFSIAYGHGPDGRLRLNFGPLALPGGETRLNVAISRARMNIKVVLYQRMAPHFERQRVTAVVREAVDKVVQKLLYRHIFFIEENMCMLRQKQSITPRQAGGREIEQISLQELGAVMKLILKKKGGISQEALIREATELLGYTRPGQRIEERMLLALSELETMGQVELVGNEMYLKEQDDE